MFEKKKKKKSIFLWFWCSFWNRGDWQPKTVDFNEAGEVRKSKAEVIPSGPERAWLKRCHKHVDPALYDGLYAPDPTSDV